MKLEYLIKFEIHQYVRESCVNVSQPNLCLQMIVVCNRAGIRVNNQLLKNENVHSFILYIQSIFFMSLVFRAVLSQMPTKKLQR